MKRTLLVASLVLSFVFTVKADEGMWLLNQLSQLNLKEKGLEIPVEDIYRPGQIGLASAVVNLGGASAELVSPDGLILTNHHVAFGAVQRASTAGTDYLTNGFLAKTRDEELPAPGYVARVLLEMKDVTDQILKGMDKIKDPVKRMKAIEKRMKQMEEEIEKQREDFDARIASMYSGKQYILFKYQRFEDVRMVFIPPRAIGNYGGDVDNWMWPRHTGDFSFCVFTPARMAKAYHTQKKTFLLNQNAGLKLPVRRLKREILPLSLVFPVAPTAIPHRLPLIST